MVNYILIFIIGILLVFGVHQCQRIQEIDSSNDALRAEVKYSKDELGRNVATIQKIETDRKNLLSIKDSSIAKLQAEVRRAGKNAVGVTIIKTVTEGKASGKTIVYVPDSCKLVGVVKNDVFEAKVEATPDSIRILYYKVFNEFVYAETTVSGGFLKPKVPVVSITANQGTTVAETKAWHVKTPKQYKGLYFIGGALVGFGSFAYIANVF